jgi:hypothetical protein
MAFRFKQASCVVVGTFNTYIIQPAWLAEVNILPKDAEVSISTRIDEPGLMFASPGSRSKWTVTPNRIMVETENPSEDCGDVVARVLAELQWTPLVALGNNVRYEAGLDELETLPGFDQYPSTTLPDGYELKERGLYTAVVGADRQFTLQLGKTAEQLVLLANAHSDLRGKPSTFAQASARRFFEDRARSEVLIARLFQGRIEDAPHGDNGAS